MNEKETYATLHCMVEASRRNKKYLRINKMQYVLFVETFSDIIKKKVPNLALRKSFIYIYILILMFSRF